MKTSIFIAAAISGFIATGAVAQVSTFDNQDRAATSVDDLEEQIADDADRNLSQFGNEGRAVGSYGSVSLRGTSTSNDGDTATDLGVGLRYGTFDGVNGIDVTASYAYGIENGTQTENQLFVGGDYRRDFSDRFFGYGKVDAAFDTLSTTAGEYTRDVFVGAGVGYRIFNDADTQWSVQAGPGYRLAEVVGGAEVNEAAASVSSNFYKSLTDSTYITNDTDVIYSEYATTITNNLAISVSLSDQLSLRTSYTTNFNDLTDSSFSDAENTLGVAVVYNFN